MFSPLPGRTNLIQHHIETEPGVVVRSRPYRLPESKKKVVQEELGEMLEIGAIEEPDSFSSENGQLSAVLCGFSQGECYVEIRRISNATG